MDPEFRAMGKTLNKIRFTFGSLFNFIIICSKFYLKVFPVFRVGHPFQQIAITASSVKSSII